MEKHQLPNSRVFEGHDMTQKSLDGPLLLIAKTKNGKFEIEPEKIWQFKVYEGRIKIGCCDYEFTEWLDKKVVLARFKEALKNDPPEHYLLSKQLWNKFGDAIILMAQLEFDIDELPSKENL